ncbi:MAG: methyltransferase [Chitinophagaceae bacterium]|nr:methyltransferase [Chitinophagaceae bacterium]
MFETTVQQFSFNHSSVSLVIPNTNSIQQWYSTQQQTNKDFPFPYWAKVWPSAIALADFLQSNKQLIDQKKVLELAAGLGLPSLMAAKFATTIVCSDYIQEPLSLVEQSIVLNKLNNVECRILDWNDLPEGLSADVLLLSDINYEPSAFNQLLKVIEFFLQNNSTIILATPQRIMAKPFIEAVLPFCIEHTERVIEETIVSILVLRENN